MGFGGGGRPLVMVNSNFRRTPTYLPCRDLPVTHTGFSHSEPPPVRSGMQAAIACDRHVTILTDLKLSPSYRTGKARSAYCTIPCRALRESLVWSGIPVRLRRMSQDEILFPQEDEEEEYYFVKFKKSQTFHAKGCPHSLSLRYAPMPPPHTHAPS
jgi:hypothetical protein